VTHRTILSTAVLAAFVITSPAFAAKKEAAPAETPPCAGAGRVSKAISKPMSEAQEAAKAKDWPNVIARVDEAKAIPGETTEYDQFLMHEFKGIATTNLKQYELAGPELEATVASPCMSQEDKNARYGSVTQIYYQLKNYDKVIDFGDKAIKAGGNPDLAQFVGNAYYLKNDNENAKRVLLDLIKSQESRGKTPEEQTYQIVQSACLKVNDNACVADMSDALVAKYPKAEYWTNVISTLLQSEGGDKQTLNVLRLGAAADALKPGQYTELAQLAIDQGLPGEAQIALEKAATKNPDAQTKERNARLLDTAKKAAALDKTTLDAQDARAKAKPTGDSDVKLGAAYLSYNQPEKAIEALTRGIGKGKLKDPNEAAILLGMAYTQVNNKEEAAKAFNTVSGTPVMTRIAKLWVMKST